MALAFVVAFAAALIIAAIQGEKPFLNDSVIYWEMGTSFTVAGHFSLLNFSSSEKGYVFPLINYGLQSLMADLAWTASTVVRCFNALTFALVGTVLGPALVKAAWPGQSPWSWRRRLVLMGLLLVFWAGFLDFPLSDFPALAAALLTLVAVSRSESPAWMLLAGAALAMTINIRASYVVFVPAVVALVAWNWFEQRRAPHARVARRVLCAALFVVGFALVSLPQALAGHRHYGRWAVLPGYGSLEPASVFLTPGLGGQGYDTYVVGNGRSVAIVYRDPAGERLLKAEPGGKIASTGQYLELIARHPVAMASLAVRHVINGLDPLYATPYVEKLHSKRQIVARIMGFLLIFIALVRLLWPAARRHLGPSRLRYMLALSMGCATVVPTEIERRYMLPLYMVSYLVALAPGWPSPVSATETGLRRYRTAVVIAVGAVAFTALVWHVTDNAISHLTFVS